MKRILFFLLLLLFCFCVIQIILYTEESARQEAAFARLADRPDLAALQAENPDLAGWIQIPDTAIDYPVMHTPDRPDHYLYRDFQGKISDYGCIYAEEGSDPQAPSDNVTLYGHAMRDGSMFAGLRSYTDPEFWETHPDIRFDSLTQPRTYQIFAVFRTSGYAGQGFAYHSFTDADTAAEFDDFVAQCKTLSLYDTGITPEYGDKLLCLSTCDYTRANGRLVVAAVLEKETPDA